MPLHRISSYTYEVPNVADVAAYYTDFGLEPQGDGWFATTHGGRQLRLVQGNRRHVTALELGADDTDDLDRIAADLTRLDVASSRDGDRLTTADPVSGTQVSVVVQDRIVPSQAVLPAYNGPGRTARSTARAEGILREAPVRPRRLGHVVIVTPEADGARKFFEEGIGFKVSDRAGIGAFLRCSTDHHNLLLLDGPVVFPHHVAWEVDDVDEIGRGAHHLLDGDAGRHAWGFGRHYAGSNFFWYLRDPAGTYTEYYADMDVIDDDAAWTVGNHEGLRGLYAWGPPVPEDFLAPRDVPDLIAAEAAGA